MCLPAPAYFSSLLLISKNQFYLYFFHELSHLSFQTISVSLMTVHTSIIQILCPILKYQVYSFQLLWVLFLIFFLIITLYGVIILSPFFSYKINIPIWGGLVGMLLFKWTEMLSQRQSKAVTFCFYGFVFSTPTHLPKPSFSLTLIAQFYSIWALLPALLPWCWLLPWKGHSGC